MSTKSVLIKSAGLFGAVVVTDQLVKFFIRHAGGFFICNENLAWGIKVPVSFFVILWVGIMLGLTAILTKQIKKGLFPWESLLIFAGALANGLDRLLLGCVVDFIDLRFWPVFNLADVLIVIGSGFLLAKIWKR